eukprot:scaffold889_cov268-Pinguiococcus_pyrenoidosus.AAC.12
MVLCRLNPIQQQLSVGRLERDARAQRFKHTEPAVDEGMVEAHGQLPTLARRSAMYLWKRHEADGLQERPGLVRRSMGVQLLPCPLVTVPRNELDRHARPDSQA